MKNIYSKATISGWLNVLKKDFSFYNKNTELLAIWTVLFITITGLFVFAIKSNILMIFLFLALSVAITMIISFLTIYYFHAIKYGNKKQLFLQVHIVSNKSFKLRTLLRFIKLPSLKNLIYYTCEVV